ncbi:MAG: carbohydrate ABC transporter permease [Ignavibacteria bacterium]|nr:carbohydrate ABC transporter permease [Ignavibacteria bacterium]
MKRAIIILTLSLAAAVAIGPFVWLISTSLKGSEELFAFPPTLIPHDLALENYTGVWNAVPFQTYLFNSVIVVLGTLVFNLTFCSLAGFALARYEFRGRAFVFLLVLAGIMIPKEVIIIPLYANVLKMQLADTLAGVVLPFAVDALGIFMMRQAFMAIPREIEEAATVDGVSPLRLWWNVMLPMTRPTLAALAIFTFIGTWGDFLWPLVVLKSREHFTLQVGLSYLIGAFSDNYRYVAAGAVLAAIPVLLVFLGMQKYFERGIFAGATK